MPVAVIDRGILTRALDVVTEAGFKVRAAYSEIYTVPAPAAGVLSVRVDRGRGIARSATHDGFAFELGDDVVPPALCARGAAARHQAHSGFRPRRRAHGAAGQPLNVQIDVSAQEADPASTETGGEPAARRFAQGGMIGRFCRQLEAVAVELAACARSADVPIAWPRSPQSSRSSA